MRVLWCAWGAYGLMTPCLSVHMRPIMDIITYPTYPTFKLTTYQPLITKGAVFGHGVSLNPPYITIFEGLLEKLNEKINWLRSYDVVASHMSENIALAVDEKTATHMGENTLCMHRVASLF